MSSKTSIVTAAADSCCQPQPIRPQCGQKGSVMQFRFFTPTLIAAACAAGVAAITVPAGVQADNITFVGVASDTQGYTSTQAAAGEVTSWRTSSVAKTYQLNGNNVYGSTLGAVDFVTGAVNIQTAGSGVFGWSYDAPGGTQYNKGPAGVSYTTIDNPAASPNYVNGTAAAGIDVPSLTFGLEGTQADYTGKVVRVGIMQNVLDPAEQTLDTGKTIQITGPGGSASPVESVTGTDGVPNMYFFDITGITAGDQFTIRVTSNPNVPPGSGDGAAGYVGPVSWDIASVPEPATGGPLLLAGTAGLLLLRRKCAAK